MATADYVPSRRPGFIVHELATYVLDQLGGSLLANLGTLFWALVAVVCFQRILRRHKIMHAELLTLALVIHPVFWHNATVSADYVWAVGMLLAGLDQLERGRFGWAGLALGLAVGCRISSGLVVGPALVYAWLAFHDRRRQVLAGGLLAGLLTAFAYVLPWDFSEWRLSFWEISTGAPDLWSLDLQVGRFFYKNLYFWGVPGALIVATLILRVARRFSGGKQPGRYYLAGLCLLALLGLQALFFRYPIEVQYLLPTLPFWLILIGLGMPRRLHLALLIVLVFSFNLVNLNLAQPDVPGQASQARLGLWLEAGYLVKETQTRIALLGCDSRVCYEERIPPRSGSE